MRLVWAIRSRLLVLRAHTCPRTARSFGPRSTTATEVASGSPLLVDVEFGRGRRLYALSQGVGSGGPAGSPALPNTGALVRVNRDGAFTVVTDGLNQPTSLEFIGKTAYVVTLGGEIWKLKGVSGSSHGLTAEHHDQGSCRSTGRRPVMTTAISEDLRARRSEIVKQHIDAENRHDPDGVVASFHQPSYDIPSFGDAGQVNGPEAVRELWQGLVTGFPDLRQTSLLQR
jgi:hypothetical protein